MFRGKDGSLLVLIFTEQADVLLTSSCDITIIHLPQPSPFLHPNILRIFDFFRACPNLL
jgi:hypothetical protein